MRSLIAHEWGCASPYTHPQPSGKQQPEDASSWTLQESQVESREQQNSSYIRHQAFQNRFLKEQEIHTNNNGNHQHQVEHRSRLSSHIEPLVSKYKAGEPSLLLGAPFMTESPSRVRSFQNLTPSPTPETRAPHNTIPPHCDTQKPCRSADRKTAPRPVSGSPPASSSQPGLRVELPQRQQLHKACSSVSSSTPMAAAIPTALWAGLNSFRDASASGSVAHTPPPSRTLRRAVVRNHTRPSSYPPPPHPAPHPSAPSHPSDHSFSGRASNHTRTLSHPSPYAAPCFSQTGPSILQSVRPVVPRTSPCYSRHSSELWLLSLSGSPQPLL